MWPTTMRSPSATAHPRNTGELLGMWNALQWAKRQGGDETFAIVFDSMYACNVTRGLWKPKKNTGIAALCFEAFKEENARRSGGVAFIHVKGHSNDPGNDKADDRVQWGKVEGPYCRFAVDGTFEGDYMDQPRPELHDQEPSPVPTHPSPSKHFNTLQPYMSNLSSIRAREDPDITPMISSTTSSARSNALQ